MFNLAQFKTKTVRQTLLLFFVQIFGMGIGFIASMLLAKQMGPLTFGIYSFSFTVLSFLAIFFEFGYFSTGAWLLAKAKDQEIEKQLIGVLIFIGLVISVLFVITVFGVSLIIDNFFKDKIGYILRLSAVVSFSFSLPFFLDLIFRGTNHIERCSLYQLVWRIGFLISVGALFWCDALSPITVLWASSVTAIFACVVLLGSLKPSWIGFKQQLKTVYNENLHYGRHVYLGRIVDVASVEVNKLLISYFTCARDVGFFNLAYTFATPISTFSRSLSASKFKSFADSQPISKRILKGNLIIVLLLAVMALVFGLIVVFFYLGASYRPVAILLVIAVVNVVLQSQYQVYNAWLQSNGYGREMKIAMFQLAAVSLLSNFLFIPWFGAIGAAFAGTCSMGYSVYIFWSKYNIELKGKNLG